MRKICAGVIGGMISSQFRRSFGTYHASLRRSVDPMGHRFFRSQFYHGNVHPAGEGVMRFEIHRCRKSA